MRPLLTLLGICLLACGNKPSGQGSANTVQEELILQDSVDDYNSLPKKKSSRPEPMEKFLKMKWIKIVETPADENRFPIASPVVKNGIVFPNTLATHAFDAYTGEKLYYNDPDSKNYIRNNVKDSLLLFQESDFVDIQNIYNGQQFRRYRQNVYYGREDVPVFLNNRLILTFEEKVLTLINIIENKTIIKRPFKSKLSANYVVADDIIFFVDKKTQYFMDFDGNLVDSLSLGAMDAKPILHEDVIYTFFDKLGLVAIDVNTHQVKWINENEWFDAELFIEGDTLFANNGCISAYNKSSGIPLWDMDCHDEEIIFTSQLVPFGNKFIGYLEGFSNVSIIGVVSLDGNIEHLYWKNLQAFAVEGEYNPGPKDTEDPNLGPNMMLSDIYDNMIFGQYNNVVVGFEIIAPKK